MAIHSITRSVSWDATNFTGFQISTDPHIRQLYQRCEIPLAPVSLNINSLTLPECGATMVQAKGNTIGVWFNSSYSDWRKTPLSNTKGWATGGSPAMYAAYEYNREDAPLVFGPTGTRSMLAQCSVAVPIVKRFGIHVGNPEALPSISTGFGFYFYVEDVDGFTYERILNPDTGIYEPTYEPLSFAYQFLVYDARPSQITGNAVMFDNVVGFVMTTSGASYEAGGYVEYQPGAAQTRSTTWTFPTPGIPSEDQSCFYRLYITPRVMHRVIDAVNTMRVSKGRKPITSDLSKVKMRWMHVFAETYANKAIDPKRPPSDSNPTPDPSSGIVAGVTFHAPTCIQVDGFLQDTNLIPLIPLPNYTNIDSIVYEWGIYGGKSWQDDNFAGVHPRIRSWPDNNRDPVGKWTIGLQYANSYKSHQDYIKPFM